MPDTISFIGNGGQVIISAPSVSVSDGGRVESNAFLIGRGGDIVIEAGRLFSVTSGGEISSFNQSVFSRGGDVKVTGGSVEISGAGSRIFSRSAQGASNDPTIGAGNISVDVSGQVNLLGGGQIQSGDFGFQGAEIKVIAGGPVVLSGVGSGISSQAFSNDVGQVAITSPTLSIDQGFVRASTTGAGNAGTVLVDVTKLTMSNNSQIASSSVGDATTGAGGDIELNATNSVSIRSGAGIFATAEGPGRAGSIRITTPNFDVQNGLVTTASAQAAGVILQSILPAPSCI